MEISELDIAIDELETRVERLRALYEQYFMGIEKIPPHVVQKDVERRVYVLRRAQIRNTARRFKLQTIIQRYNTFQQYWMRILREIENGTYRRHVLRAEKTVGIANLLTAAERKRLGLPEPNAISLAPKAIPEDEGDAQESSIASATPQSPPTPIAPIAASIRSQIERDLEMLLDDDAESLPNPGNFEFAQELDDPLSSSLPPAPRKRKGSLRAPSRRAGPMPAARQVPPTSGAAGRPGRSSSKGDSLSPSSQRESLRASSGERRLVDDRAIPRIPSDPRPPRGLDAAIPPVPPPSAGLGPQRPRVPVASAVGGRGLPPPQSAVAGRGLPPPLKRPVLQASAQQAKPLSASAPDRPGSETPASRPKGLPDIRESVIPRSNPPEVPPSAAPRVKPERPVPPRVAPPPRREEASLDRASLERIAGKLTLARRQTNEQSPVQMDALAKKLQAVSTELQKKHVGKHIDFDVVIKDGKAIVKPIVR